MKKAINTSVLLLAFFFVACAEFPTDNLNSEQENATRSEAGDNYY
jgi:PBP1b-binding outer membrane lipoprotein LpoB